MHPKSTPTPTPKDIARFHSKLDPARGADDCWEWQHAIKPNGYGTFHWGSRVHRGTYAHRFSYEIANGPIPSGQVIDHLCRNRKCVNPAHLEAVTPKTNIERGMSESTVVRRNKVCQHGHRIEGDNLLLVTRKVGADRHLCRTCEQIRAREWKQNNREHVRERERQYRLRRIAEGRPIKRP